MSDGEIDLSSLVEAMKEALEAEFPGWLISREDNGWWRASRPGWGRLWAKTSVELRARLHNVGAQGEEGDG